jgi:hypothetical protein
MCILFILIDVYYPIFETRATKILIFIIVPFIMVIKKMSHSFFCQREGAMEPNDTLRQWAGEFAMVPLPPTKAHLSQEGLCKYARPGGIY